MKDYDRGSIGGTACYSDSYKNIYENIYEQDFNFKFKVHFPDISRTSKHPDIPGMIFAPKGRLNNSSIGINIRCDHLLKVRLMLITSTKDTIVSTRTFLPKFEWDPQDYELNNSENPDKYIITNLHSKSLN
ncbi:MAG: hypothetical protein GY706_08670 [Bacteroides sp.]|nr:hypothetical protein [Bacteroides sp.]